MCPVGYGMNQGQGQGHPDVIHTLFILVADDIHTVRRVWACMWSRLVMSGCTDS